MRASNIASLWYVLASSKELGKNPLSVSLFDQEFVLWRTEKEVIVMMGDNCPHRSAKLSLDRINNNCIQCPYHGFEFDTQGGCSFVPETAGLRPSAFRACKLYRQKL